MTVKNFIKKLEKLNIEYKIETNNNFNYDIVFRIKGKYFYASYDIDKKNIDSFCLLREWDEINEAWDIQYFTNFNKIIKHYMFR